MRLALDYGQARIGVAKCDAEGLLATPAGVVPADEKAPQAIAQLVAELGAAEVFVGLPLSLSGCEGPSAQRARKFAGTIADIIGVPVYLIDERHSTTEAARHLQQAGRKAKAQRQRIDAAAATVVLQAALDAERGTGAHPGELVGLSSRDSDERFSIQ